MTTDPQGSITRLIGALAGGDPDGAAERLWDRYFGRLVRLARARLRSAPRLPADEEDVALSAFGSLCRGVAEGRFPRLGGRDDIWRLLVAITANKVADEIQKEGRRKRGGGRVVGEGAAGFDRVAGAVPTPEFLALMAEEVRALFDRLPEESLRVVALLKMEGYASGEIAASLDCTVRSVERKLERIRLLWSAGGGPP